MILVTADWHLREESSDVVLCEVMPGILAVCRGRSISQVAILGDLFHFRYKVPARIQNLVADHFREWAKAGISVRIIPGNHDQYDVDGRNALELFDELSGVEVYTQPTWDQDGFWVPFRRDTEKIKEIFHGARLRSNAPRTAWMHHGVRGAWMNDGYQNQEGLDVTKDALGFHRIFCGHYHKRQEVGNVIYIGSPYQTRADESGQPKGYGIWDGQNLEFVNTVWGKRYHRFEVKEGEALDLSGVSPQDEVRVRTIGESAERRAEELGQQLVAAGIDRHTVTPDIDPPEARLQVGDGATLPTYVQAYVKEFAGELDQQRLMGVFQELVGP